jgi:diguanylate cyclase (GGDEF)-like protein
MPLLAAEPPDTLQGALLPNDNRILTLVRNADALIARNQYLDAVTALTQAYALASATENPAGARIVLNSLANLHYSTGQNEPAERYYRELVALDSASDDLPALAVSLYNLGHVAASQQRLDEAATHFDAALQLSRQLHDAAGVAYALKALGVNAHAQGELATAQSALEEAMQSFTNLNDAVQGAAVLRHLGDLEQQRGNAALAIEHYLQALPVLTEEGLNSALLRTYRGLSLAWETLGQPDKALLAQRAFTDLLQAELEQQGSATTQRLQVELDTRQYADANARLQAIGIEQQRALDENQKIVRLQFLVLLLGGGMLALLLSMLWRSRNTSRKLHTLASTDALTGLLNRRAILEQGERHWQRTLLDGRPFSCLVFDVDFFKTINDTFGHATGDAVLRTLAAELRATFRQSDTVGRIGGEEFLLLAANADAGHALQLGERIRMRIAQMQVAGIRGRQLTISIGVACRAAESTLEHLIQHADTALYEAKQKGRNRIVVYTEASARQPVAA